MIFRRYYTIESTKNSAILKRNFLGQHLKIHNLDFEIYEKEGDIKVIPHAENDDHVYTLPITRLSLVPKSNGTTIKMRSKPRRIDIGGPMLLLVFIVFAIIAGVVLLLKGEGEYDMTSYILIGIAVLAFIFLWLRLEQGYFDYIRKIKNWVKDHA